MKDLALVLLLAFLQEAMALKVSDDDGACHVQVDMVFLVDTSENMNARDLQITKAFIWNTVTSLKESRIGIIPYAGSIHENQVLELDHAAGHTNEERQNEIYNGLKNIYKPEGNTGAKTSEGLARLRKMFEEKGRDGVPHIAVVISSGTSTDTAELIEKQSNLLKSNGVHTISIGVTGGLTGGQVTQTTQELELVATDAVSALKLESFMQIMDVDIANILCSGAFAGIREG